MTREEILKKAYSFQGANREFSQELPTVIEGVLDEIDEAVSDTATDEDIDSITKSEFDKRQYLTIEATEDGTALSWLHPSGFSPTEAKTILFSTDNGLTWNSVTADVDAYGNIGTINAGQKVLLRGNGANGFYDYDAGDYAGNFLYADKPCYVYGNAMSLLYETNFANETSVPEYALAFLFYDYNETVSGEWVLSKEGSPLVLPATTLAGNCYSNMFNGCASLASAPDLPATTLAENCYNTMFSGCTSLTTAPELPATTLADTCYSAMFSGCTSLTTAPELPATTLAENCYNSMFRGCTSLTTTSELPATTLASSCYNSMFYNCTSLSTAPELPATTLADNCYSAMFRGCTSLTTAPALPATTLVAGCYNTMFSGCTSLASVKCLASAVSLSNAVSNWLNNVSATGTFTKAAGVTWPSGQSGIPEGWTVIEE